MEEKEFTYEEIQTLADFFEQILTMDLKQKNKKVKAKERPEMAVNE